LLQGLRHRGLLHLPQLHQLGLGLDRCRIHLRPGQQALPGGVAQLLLSSAWLRCSSVNSRSSSPCLASSPLAAGQRHCRGTDRAKPTESFWMFRSPIAGLTEAEKLGLR
jgi:hypothetical protein